VEGPIILVGHSLGGLVVLNLKTEPPLAVQLRALAKQAVVVPPPGTDPGAMSQDDADHFVRQLIG